MVEVKGFGITWNFPRTRLSSYGEEECHAIGLVRFEDEKCPFCRRLLTALTIQPGYNSKGLLAGIYVVCQPCKHSRYEELEGIDASRTEE